MESSFEVTQDSSLRLLLPKQVAAPDQQQQQHSVESQRPRTPLWRAVSVLLLSMLFIALLTSLVVFISTHIVADLHLDSSTIGATLVALGSEVLILYVILIPSDIIFSSRFCFAKPC